MRPLEKILSTLGLCIFVLITFGILGSQLQRFNLTYILSSIGVVIFGVSLWTLGKWIDPNYSKEIPITAILCFLFGLPCLAFPGISFETLDPRVNFSLLTISALISFMSGIFLLKHLKGKKQKPAGITLVYAGLTYSGSFVLIGLFVLLGLLMLFVTHKKSLLD